MKRCGCCKTEKSLSEFCKNKNRSDGLNYDCKDCTAEYHRIWYSKNKKKVIKINRKNHLERTYGITLGQYDEMFEEQNGICAICGKPETATIRCGSVRRLAVDHNHKTGKVRALLCSNCNQNLGIYENEKERFEKYLRSFK